MSINPLAHIREYGADKLDAPTLRTIRAVAAERVAKDDATRATLLNDDQRAHWDSTVGADTAAEREAIALIDAEFARRLELERMPTAEARAVAEYLLSAGFAWEMGGGGCWILSRYEANGFGIWVTQPEGGAAPPAWDDWTVGVYPPDDAEPVFYLTQSPGESVPQQAITLRQAVAAAVAVADAAELPEPATPCHGGRDHEFAGGRCRCCGIEATA